MWAISYCLLLFLFLSPLIFSPCNAREKGGGSDDDGHGNGETPTLPISSTLCLGQLHLPRLPFVMNNFSCNHVWAAQNFTLMYHNIEPGLWNFVLMAPNKGGYISIGFSPNGMMVGSSAIVGWIATGGMGVVKQYYLGGKTSDTCTPDKGDLKVEPGSMAIVSQSSTLYMGFQLRTDVPEKKLIYAVGPIPSGTDDLLKRHKARKSATIEYSNGQFSGIGDGKSKASSEMCASKLNMSRNLINFDITDLTCTNAWDAHDFALYYKKSDDNLWNFVLSTPNDDSYVSIGFSTDGRMVGSSAIVGWKKEYGIGFAKQYHLAGIRSSRCLPDQGDLPLVGTPLAVLQSSRFYLAFQLNTSQPRPHLIYAIGPNNNLPGSDSLLAQHKDMTSTYLDYTTGRQNLEESSHERLKVTHGLLGMIGWGVLVPMGVLVARYCKHWNHWWFYSHIAIQGTGFFLGVAAIITGNNLEDKVSVHVDTHKSLGIVILTLGILQVLALLARPDKKAKVRRYWNWYHHNVGRIAILLAVANIFYGIHLADEDHSWNIGFGVFLGIWITACLSMEAWIRLHH